jgi:hypothetical protein
MVNDDPDFEMKAADIIGLADPLPIAAIVAMAVISPIPDRLHPSAVLELIGDPEDSAGTVFSAHPSLTHL